jgi:hypothetical protein
MMLDTFLANGVQDEIVSSHDHYAFLWLPYTNRTRTLIYNRHAVALPPIVTTVASPDAIRAILNHPHRTSIMDTINDLRNERQHWIKQSMAAILSVVMTMLAWISSPTLRVLPHVWEFIGDHGLLTKQSTSIGRGYDQLLGLPPGMSGPPFTFV